MTKLSSIADYVTDKISSNDIALREYVTTDCILQNKKGREIATNLPPQSCCLTRYQHGDVLIANIRPYLKKVWFADIDGGASSDVLVFRAKEGHSPSFLYAVLLQDSFFDYVMQGAKGSKMPRGDKAQIMDFTIPDMSLENQKKIANILSSFDSKIELNNKINKELESMAKTLYDYWFVQFDFPNENGKPYKSSGGKMVYNQELKREIPERWEIGCIGDYCKSTGGFAFKSSWWTEKGVSVIKIKDIQENYTIDISNLSKVDLSNKKIDDKFKAEAGNVLIAMTGATVGKYAIVPITDNSIYINQRVGYFNLGKEPTKKLPYFINSLNQSYFREMIFTLASGAAQPNISNEQINNIKLLIPKKDIVENFNNKLSSFYKLILNNQQQNQELSKLRDWLLPMLMNGQVRVK